MKRTAAVRAYYQTRRLEGAITRSLQRVQRAPSRELWEELEELQEKLERARRLAPCWDTYDLWPESREVELCVREYEC